VSDLSRVKKWPAAFTVAGACLLTFAGLAAAIGGNETKVAGPKPATVTNAQTSTEVAPPPKPKLSAKKKAMDAQGNREAEDRSSDNPPGGPSTTTSNAPAAGAGSMSLEHAAGRMIMTGYRGAYPSADVLRRARNGQIGGVILMGENVGPQTSSAISALQRASRQGTGHGLLIATDQEGGTVKRFAQVGPSRGAPSIAAASARAQGLATGRGLASFGVNTDFAPVADVAHPGSFMASRSFSSSPLVAASAACQFAQGLAQGGVNATLKHFPGLGYARANTDTSASTVAAGSAALAADLAPYRTCATPLVMVSNATYPALASSPAVFSRSIIDGILRGQIGFRGVVISDSLTATSVTSPTTAVRAARAGVDMLLYIDPAISALAYQKVLAAARSGQLSSSQVRASAGRIAQLTR